MESKMAMKDWLAIRKEAARHIDPATAEVAWKYMLEPDPYGIKDLSEERRQVGRGYFARSPGRATTVPARGGLALLTLQSTITSESAYPARICERTYQARR
jgi:hypothetical protein